MQLSDPRWLTGLIAAGGALATAFWWMSRRKLTPEERERARRLAVNQSRRWIEGEVAEIDDDTIHYTYDFRGVGYEASQDLRALGAMLPENPALLIGRHVTVKFDPANPANSIVICEEWSGLPGSPRNRNSISEGKV